MKFFDNPGLAKSDFEQLGTGQMQSQIETNLKDISMTERMQHDSRNFQIFVTFFRNLQNLRKFDVLKPRC